MPQRASVWPLYTTLGFALTACRWILRLTARLGQLFNSLRILLSCGAPPLRRRNGVGIWPAAAAPVGPPIGVAIILPSALGHINIGGGSDNGPTAATAAPLVTSASPAVTPVIAPILTPAFAPIIIAIARTAVGSVTPATRTRWPVVVVTTLAFLVAPATPIPASVLAIPIMPPFAPIAPVLLAHRIAAAHVVEQKDTAAGIVIVAKPATGKADFAEGVPIITLVIGVVTAGGVAAIFVVIVAVAGVAQADIIDASRQAPARHEEQGRRQK